MLTIASTWKKSSYVRSSLRYFFPVMQVVSILKSAKGLLLQAAVAADTYGLFASSVSGISTHYRQFKPLGRL